MLSDPQVASGEDRRGRSRGGTGIPLDTGFYDLGYTRAILLLTKGVRPKIVREMLGHSSITVTLDTYSHLLPNMQEKAVTAMEHIFDGKD
jgi:integrase